MNSRLTILALLRRTFPVAQGLKVMTDNQEDKISNEGTNRCP